MGEARGVKSPSVERITWATMEAVMACYASGGEGLYSVLYPFIEQARAEAFDEAAKNTPKGMQLITKCYFEIAEGLIGEDEVRRRFKERFDAALQPHGDEGGG